MESQWFGWEAFDQVDTLVFGFSQVVLVKKIGRFDAGSMFDYATVDYGNSVVVFVNFDNDGEVAEKHAFAMRVELVTASAAS